MPHTPDQRAMVGKRIFIHIIWGSIKLFFTGLGGNVKALPYILTGWLDAEAFEKGVSTLVVATGLWSGWLGRPS